MGFDVSQLKWRVCGCGLNRFVHEGMNDISNLKVHLKTRSGKVNIGDYMHYFEPDNHILILLAYMHKWLQQTLILNADIYADWSAPLLFVNRQRQVFLRAAKYPNSI